MSVNHEGRPYICGIDDWRQMAPYCPNEDVMNSFWHILKSLKASFLKLVRGSGFCQIHHLSLQERYGRFLIKFIWFMKTLKK